MTLNGILNDASPSPQSLLHCLPHHPNVAPTNYRGLASLLIHTPPLLPPLCTLYHHHSFYTAPTATSTPHRPKLSHVKSESKSEKASNYSPEDKIRKNGEVERKREGKTEGWDGEGKKKVKVRERRDEEREVVKGGRENSMGWRRN